MKYRYTNKHTFCTSRG